MKKILNLSMVDTMKIKNIMIKLFTTINSIKNGFIDIFFFQIKYLIGDRSGMSIAPLMLEKKSLYTNFVRIFQ